MNVIVQHGKRLYGSVSYRLLVIALIAVALSSSPIWLFHKSWISPNMGGVCLLYDRLPTLPNYTDTTLVPTYGADAGAMMWQHLPSTFAQAHAVRTFHEFPLWNRYNSSGTTLLGQGQMMLGDPVNWLMWAVGPSAGMFDIKFFMLRILFSASMAGIVWLLTRNFVAAALVGISAPFIGYFMSRVNHPEIFTLCYGPLILLAWCQFVLAKTAKSRLWWVVGLVVANYLVMNSGTVKEATLLMVCLNVIGCAYFISERSRFKQDYGVWWGCLVGTGICFFMMTAPWWGAFIDTLHTNTTIYSTPVVEQINLHNTPFFIDNGFTWLIRHCYKFSAINSVMFAGLVLGMLRLMRGASDPMHTMTLILVITVLVLWGTVFKVVPAKLLLLTPFIQNIHHIDMTFLALLIIPSCVLAGIGFDYLDKTDRVSVALIPLGVVVILALIMGLHVHKYTPTFWLYVVMVALVAGGAPLLFMRLGRGKGGFFSIAACALLMTIGLVRGALWPTWIPSDLGLKPTDRVNFNETPPLLAKLIPTLQQDPQRMLGVKNTLLPGVNALWGIEAINGPDAMRDTAYEALIHALKFPYDDSKWRLVFTPHDLVVSSHALDLLGVGVVLSPHPLPPPPTLYSH